MLISCCDGLLLLLESRRVSEEESRSVRLEKYMRKRGRGNVTSPFILPGKVTRAEWHYSFSLDETYKFETPTAKTIPALNNNLKFFLSAILQETKLEKSEGKQIPISNITELNELIYRRAKLVSDKIGIFTGNSNKNTKPE